MAKLSAAVLYGWTLWQFHQQFHPILKKKIAGGTANIILDLLFFIKYPTLKTLRVMTWTWIVLEH